MDQVLTAFSMTVIAGLSTGIGGFIALFAKKTNTRFLSASLGFSAGVMIYVSMVELYDVSRSMLHAAYGVKKGGLVSIAAFFGGMLIIGVIDKLIPDDRNPHEIKSAGPGGYDTPGEDSLKRTGLFTALAVGIHNFPEGLAVFFSALQEPQVAIPIVAAIAMHNIPEGIVVAVPLYYATGDRKKAFLWSLASGLAEPAGALIGYLLLRPFLNDALFGVLYAAVAGIMVFISLDELLPSAQAYGEHHLSIYGVIAGMMVMALSLRFFA